MHESKKGKLIFTVGLARSGKSTIATQWVKKQKEYTLFSDNPRVVVDGDYIRKALHGMRYVTLAEPMVHAIKMVMIRALLDSGHDVMCDDTNTTYKAIQNMFELDINAQPLLVEVDKEICIQRAKDTEQPDLILVIERMWKNLNSLVTVQRSFCCSQNTLWQDIKERIETIRTETKIAYAERVATK